jgi:hypothetical protein
MPTAELPPAASHATPATIGRHHEAALAARETRDQLVGRVARALGGGVVAAVVVAAGALGLQVSAVDRQARCDVERDQSGYGRRAALRALEEPLRQTRFLYRVTSDADGYRARVVVAAGPFIGDTWERDASGQIRHLSDVCRDIRRDESDLEIP